MFTPSPELAEEITSRLELASTLHKHLTQNDELELKEWEKFVQTTRSLRVLTRPEIIISRNGMFLKPYRRPLEAYFENSTFIVGTIRDPNLLYVLRKVPTFFGRYKTVTEVELHLTSYHAVTNVSHHNNYFEYEGIFKEMLETRKKQLDESIDKMQAKQAFRALTFS